MQKDITLQEFCRTKERRKGALAKYTTAALFLAPFIIAFIVFFIVPLFYGIYISMTNYSLGHPGKESFMGLEWFKVIFTSEAKITFNGKTVSFLNYHETFWRSFWHTIIFAVIMIPLAVIVPLALAIVINLHPPGFKLFRCLVYLPSIVPLACAGTIFVLLFNPASQGGIVNTLAGLKAGDGEFDWFRSIWFTIDLGSKKPFAVAYVWVPIFLMCFWGGWGGNFIILSAGLENVPKSLYEASSVDGCSRWKKILHVTIPNIKGQLVLCIFTTIIGYMGLYGQNFVLKGGLWSTDYNIKFSTLPGGSESSTLIYFIQDIIMVGSKYADKFYGLGAAASLVFAVLVGILTGIQQYATRNRKSGTKISRRYEKWIRVAQ